jgi:DNA-binding transcriptional regulator YiaG
VVDRVAQRWKDRQRVTPKELKKARTLLGLTQEQLAAELGVVRFSVQRWEAGVCRIPGMLTLALEALFARRTRDSSQALVWRLERPRT